MKKPITILFVLSTHLFAEYDIKNSIVKVFVTKSSPDYSIPWQSKRTYKSSGSGAYIQADGKKYILTSAHVVSNASYIEVRKNNNITKYPTITKWLANDIDLALLEVKDEKFFCDIKPLSLGNLPSREDNAKAIGFPMGGDEVSVTNGIVSRIEYNKYTHSGKKFIAIQIDTPVNPGNSGGPLIDKENKIAGIAMQGIRGANNISYIVPSVVINHFLEDIKDNKYDGMPSLNIFTSTMENKSLRTYLGMENQSGIFVNKVNQLSTNSELKPNDVILNINEGDIQNDGSIIETFGKIDSNYLIHQKQVGDLIELKLLRDKQIITKKIKLEKDKELVNLVFEEKARYFIYGGLVFTPLTQNYATESQKSAELAQFTNIPNALLEYAKYVKDGDELVVLSTILQHELNAGYSATNEIVEYVNDIKVKNFSHFVELIHNNQEKFIKFTTPNQIIILDNVAVSKHNQEILKIYNIQSNQNQ